MSDQLTHVGFVNYILVPRILSIVALNSAPVRRSVKEAQEKSLIIDMSNGRKVKSVIYYDNGHLGLSALSPETIQMRIKEGE